MHWDKSPPSVLAGSRPYKGVRVRDPVKELLRRKRSLEPQRAKTASYTVAAAAPNNQPSYSCAGASIFGVEAARGTSPDASNSSSNGWLHSSGWRGQSAMAPWPTFSDYTQVDLTYAQSLTYPTNPALTADMYMQTLCPSFTVVGPPAMLTYTHAPLIANFGTITGAPPLSSTTPQVDLQDPGLAYIPWAQPLATMPCTMTNSGVQFTTCSTTLPASPLVHVPLQTPLTTIIPQLEAQQYQPVMELLSDQHLNAAEPQPPQTLDTSTLKLDEVDLHDVVEPESPNPLERLLEDTPVECEEEEAEDAYDTALFRLNV